MGNWEHIVKVVNDIELEEQLNNHGKYGYELVQVEHFKETSTWCIFMKRQKN